MNKSGLAGSAFAVAERCQCLEWPSLTNENGYVRFYCDCGRSGKPVHEGDGAAILAAQEWNKKGTS